MHAGDLHPVKPDVARIAPAVAGSASEKGSAAGVGVRAHHEAVQIILSGAAPTTEPTIGSPSISDLCPASHEGWPHSVTCYPGPAHARSSGTIDAGDGTRGLMRAACGGLLGRGSKRRMGPAVVLGQDLTEVAGPVRHGALADLATGDRQLGNGHRKAAGR